MELGKVLAGVGFKEVGYGNRIFPGTYSDQGDEGNFLPLWKEEISGLAYDSRQVEPGFLFFCIPGLQRDGHDYAVQAVERGATVLVVERYLKKIQVPQIVVSSSRDSLSQSASNFYNHPSSRLLMVGITGTNGKTTTTHLIEALLQAQGLAVAVIGTIGNRLGEKQWPATHTTPESLELQALLAQMELEGAQAVVMEVSSHALDQGRVDHVEFDYAIFTNLTQDHLDYHGTLENYREAKSRLFQKLHEGKKSRVTRAIINVDDEHAFYFRQNCKVPQITYGLKEKATIQGEKCKVTPRGASCDVTYPGGTVALQLQLTGRFNLSNALAAFALAYSEGLAVEEIAKALGSVKGVPGRFEIVDQGQPFSVVVDYAHTPDGLENVLTTARNVAKKRVITLFGCGGDRDRTKRPKMGSIAARWSDWIVVTSDNPRTEKAEQIIEDILPGIRGVAGASYEVVVDRKEAIQKALTLAQQDDLVLIAGKGHETYQIVGTEVFPFDDRKVASDILRGLGYEKS
ncbi:UDP-N-acetylmuramoyl-L-alanyl-D-glutamate--2,6-diaminopimelate ligase [Heliorestis convoluta]|uniref:UDP-N-acetylmuramoyl-L-alanyl-D-glutamate--2,6-diaminopimelate ligase n=1 Tax=Heliorestis convoluta TaxID=356322 RepID=A0A5Q2MYN4_9FIRM|nr:UDP-N-acetylmuramoyl-L-alanyl-D-glutamate--2,6-diaminopimelate ligase [Heliorestis convoluta]QGG47848.1 UDP-N-acetylmuramoylalanyl-D-glutamate-2, 6-diaminopimelate [Heliorestis convoluta]